MKQNFKLIATIVVVLLIGIGGFCFVRWDYRVIHVSIQTDSNHEFGNTMALDISRQALQKVGKNIDELEPVKFDGTNYVVVENGQTNSGSVLWRRKNWEKLTQLSKLYYYGFTVHLKEEGQTVICEVARTE